MEEEIEHIKDLKKDLDYIVENKTLDTEVELLNAHRKSMAISFVLNELERLQKENNDLRAIKETVRYLEETGVKDDLYYVVGRGSYLAKVLENAQDFKKTVHTCLHCGSDTPLYCEKCYQELISKNAKLQLEIEELKNNKKVFANINIALDDMKEYIDGAINNILIENYIPKQVIIDKFKRINETKIKINKTNARDYMIFGNTERAIGWFINIDYIEKILLDVPGYKIGDE